MGEISDVDEVTRDWDWFAVDEQGAIGHFTTAGMRKLPRSVKAGEQRALRLIEYFGAAPKRSNYVVCVLDELESGGLRDVKDRDWYLKSFVAMASVGLFSYDTFTSGNSTDYFLVAQPTSPLAFDQLPPEIRRMLSRTKAPLSLRESPRIREAETASW